MTTSSPPIGCRSRKLSILQRPFNNHCLTFALVFETLLAFLLIYMPGNTEVNIYIFLAYKNIFNPLLLQGLQLGPLWSIVWWLPGLAFSIVLLSYEELRKAISRKHPGAWVD